MYKNKALSNSIWIISCKVIQSCLALVISMLTARYLGASNFGIINYAASLVAFFSPIANLGLNSVLVKFLVEAPDDHGKILGTSSLMSIASSILCMLGVASFSLVFNKDDKTTILVCILYSSVLICKALETVQYWFQANLMSKYVSVSSVVAYIVVSLYKIFLLVESKDVYWFALSNAIDYLVISILVYVIYKTKTRQKLSFSLRLAKELFHAGKYYILSTLMITVFAQTDKIMLKFMVDDAAVGYYSAAIACAYIFNFVFLAIIDSMRPLIFESQKISKKDFEKNLITLYSITIALSLAQSLGMTIFAKIIIHILYGVEYYPSALLLRVVVWYTTFAFIGTIRDIWILAKGYQKYLWIVNLLGAILNVLLNFVFISMWGAVGAAIASLLTQIFTNVVLSYLIKPFREVNILMIKGLRFSVLISSVREIYIRIKKKRQI